MMPPVFVRHDGIHTIRYKKIAAAAANHSIIPPEIELETHVRPHLHLPRMTV